MDRNQERKLFLSSISSVYFVDTIFISKQIKKKIKENISQLAILTVCNELYRQGYLERSSKKIKITNSKILDDGFYEVFTYRRIKSL